MSPHGLVDQYGAPLNTTQHTSGPSRDSGSYRGTIANWRPARTFGVESEARERVTTQRRASDLFVNDWAARSGVRTIADNAVGTGLTPKANIPHKLLGISREEAAAIGEKMEWAFAVWSRQAHSRGIAHFEDLQYLGITSILRLGEMLHLPVMLPARIRALPVADGGGSAGGASPSSDLSGRDFSLAVQDINPTRLCTPADMAFNPYIKDGIEFTPYGAPTAYHIATPPPSLTPVDQQYLFSSSFTRRPARIGRRPNVFHLFRYEQEEQVRGVSQLSTGMKLFRNLNDALDSELFAQVIAASFPVFIALENGTANLPPEVREAYGLEASGPNPRTLDFGPGTVTFGNPNEKPQILENNRPSSNFPPFVEIVLRALAASLGIPYESLAKDFSKTNYSSMRAALNEAWKLYMFYRRWFARMYCQPLWEMALEEAYLRNFLGLADDINALSSVRSRAASDVGGQSPTDAASSLKGGQLPAPAGGHKVPGFYEGREYWLCATWIGPARGSIDPVKEIEATILALQNRLMTYGEAWAERGGDFADALPVMEEELTALNKLPDVHFNTGKTRAPGQNEKDTGGERDESEQDSEQENDQEESHAA